jgi:hypothetical protein
VSRQRVLQIWEGVVSYEPPPPPNITGAPPPPALTPLASARTSAPGASALLTERSSAGRRDSSMRGGTRYARTTGLVPSTSSTLLGKLRGALRSVRGGASMRGSGGVADLMARTANVYGHEGWNNWRMTGKTGSFAYMAPEARTASALLSSLHECAYVTYAAGSACNEAAQCSARHA